MQGCEVKYRRHSQVWQQRAKEGYGIVVSYLWQHWIPWLRLPRSLQALGAAHADGTLHTALHHCLMTHHPRHRCPRQQRSPSLPMPSRIHPTPQQVLTRSGLPAATKVHCDATTDLILYVAHAILSIYVALLASHFMLGCSSRPPQITGQQLVSSE